MDEAESKKTAGELGEELDATGQESEKKAVKWVKEVEEKEEKLRQVEEAKHNQILSDKRKYKKNPYYEALFKLARKKLGEYDIDRGYQVDVVLKEEGKIIFGVCKIGFRWYAKGMTICGEPKYDINCVERMAVQTILSLDELVLQHEKHRTKSGIALPGKSKLSL